MHLVAPVLFQVNGWLASGCVNHDKEGGGWDSVDRNIPRPQVNADSATDQYSSLHTIHALRIGHLQLAARKGCSPCVLEKCRLF